MIRINKGDLLLAIGDDDPEIANYLDRVTGEVISIIDDMFDSDDPERIDEDTLIANPRYVAIEPISSHEAFQWMEDFTGGLDDIELRAELNRALERRGPFRGFKDVLLDHPEARAAWFEFEELQLLEAAQAWLRSEGIDAEMTTDVVRGDQDPLMQGNS